MGIRQIFLSEEQETNSGSKRHLMIVVAEKNGKYLLVPVTTWHDGYRSQDSSCILNKGDHSFIKVKSWICFRKARAESAVVVFNGIHKGIFIPKEDLRQDVFNRVLEATRKSKNLPPKAKMLL